MDAIARHDVGFKAENARRVFLHVHQVEQPELSFLVVKKQVNVGIGTRLATRGRAEQIQALNAELLQLGLVFLELGYGLIAFHTSIVAELGQGCSRVGRCSVWHQLCEFPWSNIPGGLGGWPPKAIKSYARLWRAPQSRGCWVW